MEALETVLPFIVAALFLLAIVAPLAWMMRGLGWWRASLLAVFGVGVFIASFFLQNALMDVHGYSDFVAALARIGRIILIVAVIVLVTDLAAMAAYTIRRGKPDEWKSDVDTANRGAFFQAPGSPLLTKRSKIKTLYSAGGYVQVASIVDGTATKGERMVFIGVFTALTSFFLVFVGVSLMLIGRLLFAAVLPVAAGHVLYRNVRIVVEKYNVARDKPAAPRRGD